MYKSRITIWQIVWAVFLFVFGLLGIANNFGLVSISKPNDHFVAQISFLILGIFYLSINLVKMGVKVYYENEELVISRFGKQKRVLLSSITTIEYKDNYSTVYLFTLNKKYKIDLQLERSSDFLNELYQKLKKGSDEVYSPEEVYAIMRCTVRDHQSGRLRSYLWIAIIATVGTFVLSMMLTNSLSAINIFRLVLLLVLPITTLLLAEVSFANWLEKKFRIEKLTKVERDRNIEKQIYRKYFSIGGIICLLIFATFLFR